MSTNIDERAESLNLPNDIPTDLARDYIIDMLTELCSVAEQSKQEDLLVLLRLTTQAARSATSD